MHAWRLKAQEQVPKLDRPVACWRCVVVAHPSVVRLEIVIGPHYEMDRSYNHPTPCYYALQSTFSKFRLSSFLTTTMKH